jgi:membrane-bound serine protease (ClpP class)
MIWWAIIFFLAGMALLLAEFFLPGAVAGSMGALLLVVSGAMGVYRYPDQMPLIILIEVVGAAICVIAGFLILAKTRAGQALMLDTVQRPEDGYVNMVTDHSLIGASGVVLTALRPAGSIEVGGRRIDAVSDGSFIDAGAAVRVIEVQGNRVVAERAE